MVGVHACSRDWNNGVITGPANTAIYLAFLYLIVLLKFLGPVIRDLKTVVSFAEAAVFFNWVCFLKYG